MTSTDPSRIVVVDDTAEIRDLIATYLTREGFLVVTAENGEALRQVVTQQPVDLVILDLGLPGEDGLSLTRFLRERLDVAIIIVTGKGDPIDRVVGLEIGADDYLAKPFDLRELLARVRSVLRRARKDGAEGAARNAEAPQSVLSFAGWRLDLQSRQLFAPDDKEVDLSTGEFTLLSVFVHRPNRVLSRDELLELTRHRDAGPFDRSVDVQVGRLRRKIEADPEKPLLIKSVRSVGYVFTASVDRA